MSEFPVSPTVDPEPDKVAQLIQMGIDEASARSALAKTFNDVQAAVDEVFRQQRHTNSPVLSSSSPPQAQVNSVYSEPPLALPAAPSTEDEQLQRAIAASLAERHERPEIAAGGFTEGDPRKRRRLHDVPVGLANVGNTCYVNSILQSLFFVKPFRKIVLECPVPREAPVSALLHEKNAIAFLRELRVLFAYMGLTKRSYVNPGFVLSELRDTSDRSFSIGDQKDASEFLELVLENVECAVSACYGNDSEEALRLRRMFRGALRQRRGQGFAAADEFLQLLVPVQGDDLEAALAKYLDDDQQGMIWFEHVPSVLIVTLQRVGYNATAKEARKIDTPLTVPSRMDLQRFVLPPSDSLSERTQASELARSEERAAHAAAAAATEQAERLRSHQGSGLSLEQILTMAAEHLQQSSAETAPSASCVPANPAAQAGEVESNQGAHDSAGIPSEVPMDVDPADPAHDTPFALAGDATVDATRDVSNSVALLRQSAAAACAQRKLAEERVADQINTVKCARASLTGTPMALRAVCMHAGAAMSGHYWAYARMDDQHWFRFDDRNVVAVSAENALRDASGSLRLDEGRSSASAYCLVFERVEADSESGCTRGTGAASIAPELASLVAEDNEKFAKEIISFVSDEKSAELADDVAARIACAMSCSTGIPASIAVVATAMNYVDVAVIRTLALTCSPEHSQGDHREVDGEAIVPTGVREIALRFAGDAGLGSGGASSGGEPRSLDDSASTSDSVGSADRSNPPQSGVAFPDARDAADELGVRASEVRFDVQRCIRAAENATGTSRDVYGAYASLARLLREPHQAHHVKLAAHHVRSAAADLAAAASAALEAQAAVGTSAVQSVYRAGAAISSLEAAARAGLPPLRLHGAWAIARSTISTGVERALSCMPDTADAAVSALVTIARVLSRAAAHSTLRGLHCADDVPDDTDMLLSETRATWEVLKESMEASTDIYGDSGIEIEKLCTQEQVARIIPAAHVFEPTAPVADMDAILANLSEEVDETWKRLRASAQPQPSSVAAAS